MAVVEVEKRPALSGQLAPGSSLGPAGRATLQRTMVGQAQARSAATPELYLKLFIVALFIPEGFSFFIGDFRLTVARVLLMVFSIKALLRYLSGPARVFILSDLSVLGVAIWMLMASTVTGGFIGLKGAGITAIEFAGCYYMFRYSLDSVNSSVEIVWFACKVTVVVIAVALLDPLTGTLFTYELARQITGYAKPGVAEALATHSDGLFRDGLIRAEGPLEHSILFGCVCAWFGTLAFFTFPRRFFGWCIAAFALVGLWFSQARGAWVAYIIAFALSGYYVVTRQFPLRWKLVGLALGVVVISVFLVSGSPIATLMKLGGLSPEAAWYREAIWTWAWPLVMNSPLFGIGSSWDWEASGYLVGSSVDAFWLENSMEYGFPATVFVFLTVASPFWRGPMDNSPYLSPEERRLSVALGIVTTTFVFMGFIVHFWGICWILVGAFPAIRASLDEAVTLRERAAQPSNRHRRVRNLAIRTKRF